MTSSPLHSSGNGQVERTVGTVKSMMRKCMRSGEDWLIGLLTIRNTPVDTDIPSPAQLLQGRMLRDDIPRTKPDSYLVRDYDIETIRTLLGTRQSKQKYYHDNHVGPEKQTLEVGARCMFKTARGKWKYATVRRLHSDRSYLVVTPEGLEYRRNRKDIRPCTFDRLPQPTLPPLTPVSHLGPPISDNNDHLEAGEDSSNNKSNASSNPHPIQTRSGREVKKPGWHKDYVFD